jgi:tetratricopeptide (TPR) repeat protein
MSVGRESPGGAGRPSRARGASCVLFLLGSFGCSGGERSPAATPPQPVQLAPELRTAARAIEERRYDVGRELAQAYLAAHPQDGQAHYFVGLSHYWTGNYGAARPFLERALELAPELWFAHDTLGSSLFLLGELGPARREYEAYLAAAPGDPKGHYGLGLIELEEARLAEAAGHFRRALELFEELGRSDPRRVAARQSELAECRARLGEVHFALGEHAAAREELLRATAIAPGNISAFYTLSLVHRRLGEEALADQAAARYESARRALVAQQGAGQE